MKLLETSPAKPPLFFESALEIVEGNKMENKIVNCPHCGKIIPEHVLKSEPTRKTATCPEYGSQRNCKDGMRQTGNMKVQRYLCHDCNYRFS